MSIKISRIITALFLLLITGCALAASAPASDAIANAHAFADTLAPPISDYSVAYLSQIFGTVGNVLMGSSGQILGTMFKILNEGVLVVAALWLGYTVLTTALNAAKEGSWMGQNKNIAIVLLRIALGFVLILPSSATGYSLLQDLYMRIVVQGVGLGDQIWDAAIQYFEHGGELYIPPATLQTANDMIPALMGASSHTPGTVIFLNEVCMIKSQDWRQNQNSQLNAKPGSGQVSNADIAGNIYNTLGNEPSFPYEVRFDENTGMVYFPGAKDAPSSGSGQSCGTAQSYTQTPAGAAQAASLTSDQLDRANYYSFSALKQLTLSLLPAAREYADNSQSMLSALSPTAEKNVLAAVIAYGNLITPYQNMMTSSVQKTANQYKALDLAQKQGWIMAGAFYWEVERTNKNAQALDVSALLPVVTKPDSTIWDAHKTTFENAQTAIGGSQADLNQLWITYVGAEQNSAVQIYDIQGGGGSDLLSDIVDAGVSNLSQANLSDATVYNPIASLMKLGGSLLNAVTSLWIAAIGISAGIGLAAGICSSEQPAAVVFQAALSWVKSIVMLLSTVLLVPGAILAYYVPLYPFILYTFAAIGWIVLVIEGMAAAPLVCLGLTHPDNHDFLGKAEQALMLFLSIFLRPGLMVIGLIASMLVSFVAFKLMLAGFSTIFPTMQASTVFASYTDTPLLQLLEEIVVMVLLGMLSMQVVEQSFKLIFRLPNYVVTWIGAPQQGDDYSQSASAIQSAVGGIGKPMSKAVGATAEGTQGVAKGTAGLAKQAYGKVSGGGAGDIKGGGGDGAGP